MWFWWFYVLWNWNVWNDKGYEVLGFVLLKGVKYDEI